MANLWTGEINTQGVYQNLETLSELTFTSGNKYVIQGWNGEFYLREGTTGKGFLINSGEKVEFTAASDDLYIMTDDLGKRIINIAG